MDSAINIVCYGVTTRYLLTLNPPATEQGLFLFIIRPETVDRFEQSNRDSPNVTLELSFESRRQRPQIYVAYYILHA